MDRAIGISPETLQSSHETNIRKLIEAYGPQHADYIKEVYRTVRDEQDHARGDRSPNQLTPIFTAREAATRLEKALEKAPTATGIFAYSR